MRKAEEGSAPDAEGDTAHLRRKGTFGAPPPRGGP